MKILVIEDEEKAATYIKKGLCENGFQVDVASDGDTGLSYALSSFHDLIVLDIMLPLRDGWSIIQDLRSRKCSTPVLVLTARDAVNDRVKGLELGADDYLAKPFAFSELLARIRSILRRGAPTPSDCIKVGDLEIDVPKHRISRGAKQLELTPKEFALLLLFARREGEVLSRTFISEQVWGINFDCGTNVVDVHIRRLRLKVDFPFENELLHTVRGAGYVLEERSV